MLDPKNSSKMPNFLKEPNLKAKNSCFCGEYYTTLPNTLVWGKIKTANPIFIRFLIQGIPKLSKYFFYTFSAKEKLNLGNFEILKFQKHSFLTLSKTWNHNFNQFSEVKNFQVNQNQTFKINQILFMERILCRFWSM